MGGKGVRRKKSVLNNRSTPTSFKTGSKIREKSLLRNASRPQTHGRARDSLSVKHIRVSDRLDGGWRDSTTSHSMDGGGDDACIRQ